MVKVVELKCPSCNAALTLEEGREQIFCQYCGAKVVLHNENEHIYRHIDENCFYIRVYTPKRVRRSFLCGFSGG